MVRRVSFGMFIVALAVLVAIPVAFAQQPNFSASLYADGQVWGTKGTTTLPAPNGHNDQSFDRLFVILNGVPGQLPVGEAAPGNTDYSGGRWWTHTVSWMDPGEAFLLTSYADLIANQDKLIITPGSFEGGPPEYFQCPLLPVK